MSESTGYERDKCQVKVSKECAGTEAGYQRTKQFARVGPWLDACEACARTEYEQSPQLQKQEDPAQGF